MLLQIVTSHLKTFPVVAITRCLVIFSSEVRAPFSSWRHLLTRIVPFSMVKVKPFGPREKAGVSPTMHSLPKSWWM